MSLGPKAEPLSRSVGYNRESKPGTTLNNLDEHSSRNICSRAHVSITQILIEQPSLPSWKVTQPVKHANTVHCACHSQGQQQSGLPMLLGDQHKDQNSIEISLLGTLHSGLGVSPTLHSPKRITLSNKSSLQTCFPLQLPPNPQNLPVLMTQIKDCTASGGWAMSRVTEPGQTRQLTTGEELIGC